ncbi:hypothetical protein JXB37_04360, partial [candidate division WOR-3 bacterium]|nr:hypothetical protein [candidate division WOR-3 bacterium]
MTARAKFEATLARADSLCRVYDEALAFAPKEHSEFDVEQRTRLDDILRAALVLGVSAFDAFFTDRFAEVLVPFVKKFGATKPLVALLEEAGLNVQAALELAMMERPFWRVRSLVAAHHSRYVTQDLKRINSLYAAYALPGICARAERKAGRKTLCRNVNAAVQRRHAIVHAGDIKRRGGLNPIEPGWTQRRLADLRMLVQYCDAIVADKMAEPAPRSRKRRA